MNNTTGDQAPAPGPPHSHGHPEDSLPDPEALAAEINARLGALPPEARTEDHRSIRREYSRKLRSAPPRYVVALGRALIIDYSRRSTGFELIHCHQGALLSLTPGEVEALAGKLDSWWSVDYYAANIAGPAWRLGIINDAVVAGWAASPDRWWRRTALVATVYLHRAFGGSSKVAGPSPGHVERTLEVCRTLAADHDDMVVKAMSWALRELSSFDREAVVSFLAEHNTTLAARVKREVKHKLATGLKNPRRPRQGSG